MDILKELNDLRAENERLRKSNVFLYGVLHSIHGLISAMPPQAAQEYDYAVSVYNRFEKDMEGVDYKLASDCARLISYSSSIRMEMTRENLYEQIVKAMADNNYSSIQEILQDARTNQDDPELNQRIEELIRQVKEKMPVEPTEKKEERIQEEKVPAEPTEKKEEKIREQKMSPADIIKGQYKKPDAERRMVLSK